MAIINPTFPPTTAPATANYDWFDLAEGTGFKTFYGFSTDEPTSEGEQQLLTTQPLYSNSIQVSGATLDGISLSGAYTTLFNVPKDVEGNAYVSFGWSSNTNSMFPFCKIYKRVDGADTLLAEVSGAIEADAANKLPKVSIMKAVIPLTHFAQGDTLKLKAGITGAAGGAGAFSNFGQDPQDRDGIVIKPSTQSVTTILSFDVPFRINAVT